MTTNMNAGTEERLIEAVERLASIQRSMMDLRKETNLVRNHIRDFDVNMEALNILVTLRSKDEKEGGVPVLEDLVTYARLMGTPLETHVEGDSNRRALVESVQASIDERMEHAAEGESRESTGVLKLLSQLLVATALTFGLFVLIH